VTTTADVIVIGGGIAGLTAALAAAAGGLAVVVIDSARPGAASRAAAGMLAPSVEGMPPHITPLALEARDFYPDFLAALHARTGVDVPLNRAGIIELAASGGQRDQLFTRANDTAHRLDERAVAALEPSLAGHAGGLLYPLDGAVDNVLLMTALDRAVASEPNIRRLYGDAHSMDFSDVRPIVQTTDGTGVEAATVLLASGAWATQIAGLPRRLPVAPVHGQLLRLDAAPVRHVVYGGGGYLIPRGDSVIVGATSEDVGFDVHTNADGHAALLGIAASIVPGVEKCPVLDHWSGLRPMTPDTLPILGPDPDCPALVYACGFSRNGILLAPWAAAQLAPILAGERRSAPVDLLSVRRFSK
jgi:glycine oxidase ThiO